MTDVVLLTCEHGGNRVPAQFASLFRGRRELLDSHRGYDPGALELARTCARRLQRPLHCATVTRLLVELNRSLGHPALFSVATRSLSAAQRRSLLEKYYFPYRRRVETDVEHAIEGHRKVLHLSFHTFTPVLDGEVRRADVGLLYDPGCQAEKSFSAALKNSLASRRPDLIIRKNSPYTGKSDSLTTTLRRRWGAAEYAGIELEVNQRWHFGERRAWRRLQRDFAEALADAIRSGTL